MSWNEAAADSNIILICLTSCAQSIISTHNVIKHVSKPYGTKMITEVAIANGLP